MKHTYWKFAKDNLKGIWIFTGLMLVFIWAMYLFWDLALGEAIGISLVIKVVNVAALLGSYMSYKKKQRYDAFDQYEDEDE